MLNPRGASNDWQVLCQTFERPDLPLDARFATGKVRRQNSAALVEQLDATFGALDYAEIIRRLDAADQVWAPVQTPADVVADPQAAAAGAFVEIEDGQGGAYRSPAAPARFPGADADRRPPAPGLGEHTREVLSEIGYSPAEIDAMLSAGAAA